ncbi:unnamed protein product [Plutella xylostella]|uniref:(diamondback moth) hypothetical protein n=1 Tax=Plutella xylostella TaxID=51655 RepID=A0A8S4ECS2_PLUXY|nr:unnamed protein product [Plutella xylostella]
MMLAGVQVLDKHAVQYRSHDAPASDGGSGAATPPDPAAVAPAVLPRGPARGPVDMNFTNVTCTVKLGINKGGIPESYPISTLYNICNICSIYLPIRTARLT